MGLRDKMDAGKFVLLAEMEPPKGVDVSALLAAAAAVRDRVDALVVPEMGDAVMKMSSLGGAALLGGQGFETVMQVSCRDRNRLALQADLLAAWALGVGAILAVQGENPSQGDHHTARPVFDLDLVELLETVGRLNSGRDLAGAELAGRPGFLIGSTFNPDGDSPERELAALDRKIAAGASFFVTPPVFEAGPLLRVRDELRDRQVRLVPTVLVLKSVGMARYLDRHFRDVSISDRIMARLQQGPDRVEVCLDIARELIEELKAGGLAGVMISPSGWEDRLPRLLDGLS